MSATAPMSLRKRMGMGTGARLREPAHNYMVRVMQSNDRMTRVVPALETRRRTIRLWLLAVAALMFATLVVGGATRLTESGLSIVEWKPVTGVIPPLGESAWQAEFAKYQAIPQYR